MAAHRVLGAARGEIGRGDVIASLEAAAVLDLGAGRDADQRHDVGKARLAGKTTLAGQPVDLAGDRDGALLDAAVALVDVAVDVEIGRRRVGEE